MRITDLFTRHPALFSFEFFPPKNDVMGLFETIRELEPLRPSFVSVTYGAGGSTRERTHDLVVALRQNTSLTPVPHLTCFAHSKDQITAILGRYAEAGIQNLMALRGDRPADGGDPAGDFRTAADLVAFVRAHAGADRFCIGVAGYPEGHPDTPNRLIEMDYLKAKVDAGADFIITQLFFDNRDYYDFRERCRLAGIKVPIIAGIMPITSVQGMKRMAQLALGTRYPAPLLRAVGRAISGGTGDPDAAVRRVGVHWATEQCRDLLDHQAAGIHFYTLNHSTATREIYANLGVRDSDGLAMPSGEEFRI